jgi:hypothetical protein
MALGLNVISALRGRNVRLGFFFVSVDAGSVVDDAEDTFGTSLTLGKVGSGMTIVDLSLLLVCSCGLGSCESVDFILGSCLLSKRDALDLLNGGVFWSCGMLSECLAHLEDEEAEASVSPYFKPE